MKLIAKMSVHNQWCIEVINPSREVRKIIRETVLNNYINSEDYKQKTPGGPFLQCDHEDYILVEFWGDDFEPFVKYLNKKLEKVT